MWRVLGVRVKLARVYTHGTHADSCHVSAVIRTVFAVAPAIMSSAPDPEAWRALGNDTEAGRLLAKLYGGTKKVKIEYPPVRTRAAGPRRAFIPAGGLRDVDPREARIAHVPLHVPDVGHGEARHYAPIELARGGRKSKEVRGVRSGRAC